MGVAEGLQWHGGVAEGVRTSMSFLYSTLTIGISACLSSTPLPPAARLLTARLAVPPTFLVPALKAATCLRFSAI